MIAAQYERWSSRPAVASSCGSSRDSGPGAPNNSSSRAPDTAIRASSTRPWPTSCPRNQRWQRAWTSSGADRCVCLEARSSWDPRWILAPAQRWSGLDNSTSYTSIRRSWPSGARLALRSIPRRERPRIVVTEHNVWSSHARLTRLADRLTAGASETHLAVSAAVRDSLPARIRARTRVIRYGVDTAEIRRGGEHRAGRAATPRRVRRRDPDRYGGQSPGHEGVPRPARRRPRGHRAATTACGSSPSAADRSSTELRRAAGPARARRPVPVPRLSRRRGAGHVGLRRVLPPLAPRRAADRPHGGARARPAGRRDPGGWRRRGRDRRRGRRARAAGASPPGSPRRSSRWRAATRRGGRRWRGPPGCGARRFDAPHSVQAVEAVYREVAGR